VIGACSDRPRASGQELVRHRRGSWEPTKKRAGLAFRVSRCFRWVAAVGYRLRLHSEGGMSGLAAWPDLDRHLRNADWSRDPVETDRFDRFRGDRA